MPTDRKYLAVETYLRAQIGDPIIDALSNETDTIQNSINLALLSYWVAFPHLWMMQYSSKARGTITDSVDNILNQAFLGNPDALKNAYFLGVTRVEDGALGAIGNNIDSYLLGVPYPNPSYKVYPGALDLAEIVRYRTEVSIITGEIEIQYDDVTNTIHFLTPNAYGQFTVFYAFGFTESAGLTFIPNRMMPLFRKMSALEFLTMVINARGNVAVNADFKLDVSYLTKRRDVLRDEVDRDIANSMISTVMIG